MPKEQGIMPVKGALFLAEKYGFKVFPLLVNDKKPAFANWQAWSSTATLKKIKDFGTANPVNNWGVHAGASDLIVIDLDTKNGQNGLASITAALGGKPQKTFTVKTPSGGLHLYYRGSAAPAVGVLPGVDVRAGGSYVVAPDSAIDNIPYRIIDDADIVPIPTNILDIVLKAKKKEPLKTLDDKTIFPAGERDTSLTRYAGKLRAIGLDKEELFATLSQMNQTRCVPPLPDQDIERIANSMMRYAPEIAESGANFDKVETSSPSEPISADSLTGQPPKRSWLVKDWIPEGEISSLYGSGGTGKSLIALQLACCVASGKPWLGLEITSKMPTLAVFCEDTKDELHRRIHDIRNAPEYSFVQSNPDDVCLLWPRVGLMNDIARENDKKTDIVKGLFRKELEDALKKMPQGPKLLILDTLSDIYLGDENVREKVNKFVKTHLGSLVKEFGCTLLLLAHPSRQGQNTGDILSGSTAWENAVRNRLALIPYDKKVDTGLMCLVRMKSNYAKRGEKLVVRWDAGRYLIASAAEMANVVMSVEDKNTLEALNEVLGDTPMSLNELAQAAQKSALSHLAVESIRNRIKKVLVNEVEFNGSVFIMENIGTNGGRPSYSILKRSAVKVSSFGAENCDSLEELLS